MSFHRPMRVLDLRRPERQIMPWLIWGYRPTAIAMILGVSYEAISLRLRNARSRNRCGTDAGLAARFIAQELGGCLPEPPEDPATWDGDDRNKPWIDEGRMHSEPDQYLHGGRHGSVETDPGHALRRLPPRPIL